MKGVLYNKQHVREYLLYGLAAAIVFIIPVVIFFTYLDYNRIGIVYLGSILFMFVIMLYVIRLSGRRPEYKSAWMMIVASHFAVLTGIIFSLLFTTIACFIFIPEFLSGHSDNVLEDAPAGLNNNNWSLITLLYICATIENFGAGGFMAILGPYVFKKNQTKDEPVLEKNVQHSNS